MGRPRGRPEPRGSRHYLFAPNGVFAGRDPTLLASPITGPVGNLHLAVAEQILATDQPLAFVPGPGASALLLGGLASAVRWRRRLVVE